MRKLALAPTIKRDPMFDTLVDRGEIRIYDDGERFIVIHTRQIKSKKIYDFYGFEKEAPTCLELDHVDDNTYYGTNLDLEDLLYDGGSAVETLWGNVKMLKSHEVSDLFSDHIAKQISNYEAWRNETPIYLVKNGFKKAHHIGTAGDLPSNWNENDDGDYMEHVLKDQMNG